MNCPVCTSEKLLMSERQGIEIDYCPKCRGVWLDRGELDKLIEKSSEPPPQQAGYRPDSYQGGKHHRKRKGLLGELFDFD
jgi:uncharacterized protein